MSALLTESMRRIGTLLQSGQFRAAHAQLESLVNAIPDYVERLRRAYAPRVVIAPRRPGS
jgi:hypothetical protein